MASPLDNPRVRKRALRALLVGCDEVCAAACAGVSPEQLDRWCRRAGAPGLAMQRARQVARYRHARLIDHSRDWRAHAWLLERLFPEEFHPASRDQHRQTDRQEQAQAQADEQTRKRLLDMLEEAQTHADRPGEEAPA
jgi:hypothetical protein